LKGRKSVTIRKSVLAVLGVLAIEATGAPQAAKVETKAPPVGAQVHMLVTVEPLKDDDKTVPALSTDDVKVRQGRNALPVTQWIPARGEQGALQLFILIDDTSDTSLGSQLDDLRSFVEAQPASTAIGLGYMRNTSVSIVQNFTNDHAQVAKAIRLPLGSVGASDSPYLSLVGLVKGWPENKVRREVLMITDGIDRLRGNPNGSGVIGPGSSRMQPSLSIPYISPDVDRASRDAQRSGVIVHSIYTRGVGHAGRNFFDANNGQNGLSKLSDETGGESFMLGLQNAVSFKPYLERIQSILDNQYYLVFVAKPGKKADLQRVKIDTEVPKVEIVSADSVWVPAAASADKK
jgi:hypothetical protein